MKTYPSQHVIFNVAMLTCIVVLSSCQSEPEAEPNGGHVPKTNVTIEPDVVMESLVLNNATRMDGNLPPSSVGQLKMDVEDTIFVVKGHPIGNRIRVRHDTNVDVSGFYVQVSSASIYYDVPEQFISNRYLPDLADENGDMYSTSVFVMDLDLEGLEEIVYPFTTGIKIQPHDPSGTPLDEFTREITVEDPDNCDGSNPCNTILRKRINSKGVNTWEWDFTIREVNGVVMDVFAPGLAQGINSAVGGCCIRDIEKTYYTSDNGIYVCNGPDNTSLELDWVELDVDDFLLRTFEVLNIFDDGIVDIFGEEMKQQYSQSATNFCAGTVGYTHSRMGYGPTSLDGVSHDYTPCANHITFKIKNWSGGWQLPQQANLIYTCHTLILSWGGFDKFYSVYQQIGSTRLLKELKDYEQAWFD